MKLSTCGHVEHEAASDRQRMTADAEVAVVDNQFRDRVVSHSRVCGFDRLSDLGCYLWYVTYVGNDWKKDVLVQRLLNYIIECLYGVVWNCQAQSVPSKLDCSFSKKIYYRNVISVCKCCQRLHQAHARAHLTIDLARQHTVSTNKALLSFLFYYTKNQLIDYEYIEEYRVASQFTLSIKIIERISTQTFCFLRTKT